MSLSRGEINPLGVLGMRKLSFIPEHFAKISIENLLEIKLIEHWITYNLNSRYAIIKKFTVNSENSLSTVLEIGLEDPKELTILSLGCPYLHNNKE